MCLSHYLAGQQRYHWNSSPFFFLNPRIMVCAWLFLQANILWAVGEFVKMKSCLISPLPLLSLTDQEVTGRDRIRFGKELLRRQMRQRRVSLLLKLYKTDNLQSDWLTLLGRRKRIKMKVSLTFNKTVNGVFNRGFASYTESSKKL